MKTCKYKHKIISPFSSRHLGWIPLLMWTKTTLYFTPFTISILFSRHLPWMSFFVSCIFTLRFFKCFPCFLLVQTVGHFPAPPHTHLWPVWRAFPSTHTNPPQTICLICFVFSNELDVKFNTHTHSHTHMQKKNCAELFLFEFFDSQSRKLLKRVKVSQKKNIIFFMIIEKEEGDKAVVVWRSKKHPQIKHTNTYPSTHIFRVLSKVMQKWSF